MFDIIINHTICAIFEDFTFSSFVLSTNKLELATNQQFNIIID